MIKAAILSAVKAVNRLIEPSGVYFEIGRMHTHAPNPTLGKPMPAEIISLPRANEAMFKLLTDYKFDTVLDVGSGAGAHAAVLREHGKKVIALDFGKSVYFDSVAKHDYELIVGDFLDLPTDRKFDCIWASHVLEHQSDPSAFIRKCVELLHDDGILAITVPPLKHTIVGGHLTLWNAGLLLYQLAFNGIDCRNAAVRTHGYNVSVIVQKRLRGEVELDYDSGDIDRLSQYLPPYCHEFFDGRIAAANW